MTYQYTTVEYLNAIERERFKRASTYPKIIAKKENKGMGVDEVVELKMIQATQNLALNNAKYALKGISIEVKLDWILDELIREYKMRLKCYKRFVYLKRMTQKTADYELAVWKELCIWFADDYMSDPQLAIMAMEPKRRKRAQV